MPGMWLKDVEQMRKVEWSKSWLWDLRFPNPGPNANVAGNRGLKLSSWFPATSVEVNTWTLDTQPFNIGMTTIELPKSTTLFNLKVGFVDDINLTVQKWVTAWVNDEILMGKTPTQQGILCLEKAVKQVEVAKLTNKNELLELNTYWVYPKGAMYYKGSSDSQPMTDDLEFIIAATGK